MTPPMKLGRTVRAIRERLGLTREAMADRLAVSLPTMEAIEANAVPTPDDFIARFHAAFDIDLHTAAWCLFGDNTKLPESLQSSAAAITESCRAELMAKLGGGPVEGHW
jgi:transcriptional regulator with XRE-family HTH domain